MRTNWCRATTMTHSTSAAAATRASVKLAASMVVPFSASRHSSELPAKASIASAVSTTVFARGMRRGGGGGCVL